MIVSSSLLDSVLAPVCPPSWHIPFRYMLSLDPQASGTGCFFCCFSIWGHWVWMVLLTGTWAPDRLTPFRRWLAAHGGTLSCSVSTVQSQHFPKSHKALHLSTSSQAANLLTFLQIPQRGIHLHSSACTLASPGNYTGGIISFLWPGYMEFVPELAQNSGGECWTFLSTFIINNLCFMCPSPPHPRVRMNLPSAGLSISIALGLSGKRFPFLKLKKDFN